MIDFHLKNNKQLQFIKKQLYLYGNVRDQTKKVIKTKLKKKIKTIKNEFN